MKEQQQLDTALACMTRFREEMARTAGPGPTVGATGADPTPTQPEKIPELVAELDRLTARVAEMEIEREEVRKKTFTVSVSAFPGFGCWPRCVVARVGSSARSACWPTPGRVDGNSDQSWEHSGPVKPIQPVQSRDERAIEVLAMGLPIQQGAQLAVDITLRSALATTGEPCPNGAIKNGALLQLARHLKNAKYWELLEGDRCRFVVIGVETGGRFSPEAVNFVDALAAAKARDSPPVLRRSAHFAWRRRWMRMLAVSCGRSFAASLVAGPSHVWSGTDGCVPEVRGLYFCTDRVQRKKIQPVSMKKGHTHHVRRISARYGLRGVRVGEEEPKPPMSNAGRERHTLTTPHGSGVVHTSSVHSRARLRTPHRSPKEGKTSVRNEERSKKTESRARPQQVLRSPPRGGREKS